MKKTIIAMLPLLLLGVGACKKLDNVNPKSYASVPAASLFTQSQRVLTNTLTSTNVNSNIFRLTVQHWEETTYTDEANYDFTTRPIPDQLWNALYRDILNNLRLCKENLATDATITSEDVRTNDLALTDIMAVYTWYYVVTTFGDAPYSEAFDATNTFPKYDDATTIYNDLLTRLDADIAALNTGAGSFGGADIVYKGDVTQWKKFANSLKVKMGITIADSDPAKAKSTVESAYASGVLGGNVLTLTPENSATFNVDNATFNYLSSPPNTNPIWVDLVQSGRNDFVASKTLITALEATNDPRESKYFTPVVGVTPTTYLGVVPGAGGTYDSFSHVADAIKAPTFPGLLLDKAETELSLAEAAARGYSVGGTAAEHYAAGVTASILYWGGTTADAATYLAQSSVAYVAGSYKQKIGLQKWLALYNRGWDAWIEVRRLDYPNLSLTLPVEAKSGYPNRLKYPINETNINGVNNAAAASAIGGDKVETKLFFDKN